MKFFVFILAMIVLALSCMPCRDNSFALKMGKSKIGLAKNHTDQDKDGTDACSPFFQCSCCAGFSVNHQLAEVSKPLPFHCTQYNTHYIVSIIEISLPVWQPPQL